MWWLKNFIAYHRTFEVHCVVWSDFRMTFKMYAVDFCELLLFDEHKQAYHLVLHCFEKKNVLDAYIK